MQILTCVSSLLLFSMLGPGPSIFSFEEPKAITSEGLRGHVSFLASDELGGRALGTPGMAKAAEYLAQQLKSYNLQPAGDGDSFLQAVTFERRVYGALPELTLRLDGGEQRELKYGGEFRIYKPSLKGVYDLLLVGEGSEVPEDLGSETMLCFPDLTRGKALRWLEQQGYPKAEGLCGVITFMRRAGKPTEVLPRDGRFGLVSEESAPAPLWLELSPDLRDSFSEGGVIGVQVDTHMSMEQVISHNVIARLPSAPAEAGSDLAQQAIVVSAHYDHLGLMDASRAKPTEDGSAPDLIFNGADDDASGVATVLEIARSLGELGPQKREVIFLLATAEELGILGTSYYLDHPSTPLERTVANLNFEMVGRPDPLSGGAGRLWLSGAERTNLMEAFAENGFLIVADPYPKMNFFERSDNIVFCRRGIVGQTFSTYNLHKDYHNVSDDTAGIDFEHMESCARAGLQAVRLVADGSIDPKWLPGGMPKQR